MKKLIWLCLFLGIACFTLPGCGGRAAAPAGTPDEGEVFEPTAEDEATNDGH